MAKLTFGTITVDEEERVVIIDGVWFDWDTFEATEEWDIDGLESTVKAMPVTTDSWKAEEADQRAIYEGAIQGGFHRRD